MSFKGRIDGVGKADSGVLRKNGRDFSVEHLFDSDFSRKMDEKLRYCYENFDKIVADSLDVPKTALAEMPRNIKFLSRLLTYARNELRLDYMNDNRNLSAYAMYFQWWNIFRLGPLFARLDDSFFAPLEKNPVIFDGGSGPLTVPIALFFARPDLRKKPLTFYCVDRSRSVLALGESLLLSIQAKSGITADWKIVRVCDDFFTVKLRQQAGMVFCANALTEREHKQNPVGSLLENAAKDCSVFVVEPGTPVSSKLLVKMRDVFAGRGFFPHRPCPTCKKCPKQIVTHQKWCHFTLDVEKNAPEGLRKISVAAGLQKEKASVSFLAMSKVRPREDDTLLSVRVFSDVLRLSQGQCGRYGCSSAGLILLMGKEVPNLQNGDLLTFSAADCKNLPRDEKSGALIISLS